MATTSISGLPETLTINGATVGPFDYSASTFKVSVTTLGAFITQNATTVSATGTVTGGNLSTAGTVTAGTLSVTGNNNVIPTGVIVMWSGSIATIPTNWYLCNGANGTPDLRDKFIVGAGSTYAVAASGGSANATLVSHTHIFTGDALPTHLHGSGVASGGGGGSFYTATGSPEVNQINTSAVSAGTPAGTNSTEGSSATNANLPPYYALAYIMKA